MGLLSSMLAIGATRALPEALTYRDIVTTLLIIYSADAGSDQAREFYCTTHICTPLTTTYEVYLVQSIIIYLLDHEK